MLKMHISAQLEQTEGCFQNLQLRLVLAMKFVGTRTVFRKTAALDERFRKARLFYGRAYPTP